MHCHLLFKQKCQPQRISGEMLVPENIPGTIFCMASNLYFITNSSDTFRLNNLLTIPELVKPFLFSNLRAVNGCFLCLCATLSVQYKVLYIVKKTFGLEFPWAYSLYNDFTIETGSACKRLRNLLQNRLKLEPGLYFLSTRCNWSGNHKCVSVSDDSRLENWLL